MIKLLNLDSGEDEYRGNVQQKQKQETASCEHKFKCTQCEYRCNKDIKLVKHTNTMYPVLVTKITRCDLKCPLCEN